MKFELVLLFALVGSFCTSIHASTLVTPTELIVTETAKTLHEEETSLGDVASKSLAPTTTEAVTEKPEVPSANPGASANETETPAHTEQSEAPLSPTTAPAQEKETTVVLETSEKTSEGQVDISTTQSIIEVTETDNTADNTETPNPGTVGESRGRSSTSDQMYNTERDQVEVEDSEAMSTGQVVGIVIGALIAVVIIIAVIVVVVRRMGQYSP